MEGQSFALRRRAAHARRRAVRDPRLMAHLARVRLRVRAAVRGRLVRRGRTRTHRDDPRILRHERNAERRREDASLSDCADDPRDRVGGSESSRAAVLIRGRPVDLRRIARRIRRRDDGCRAELHHVRARGQHTHCGKNAAPLSSCRRRPRHPALSGIFHLHAHAPHAAGARLRCAQRRGRGLRVRSIIFTT